MGLESQIPIESFRGVSEEKDYATYCRIRTPLDSKIFDGRNAMILQNPEIVIYVPEKVILGTEVVIPRNNTFICRYVCCDARKLECPHSIIDNRVSRGYCSLENPKIKVRGEIDT